MMTRIEAYTAYVMAFVIAAALGLSVSFGAVSLVKVAQAAGPQNGAVQPISDNCELDSTIGILEVYFCDSDFGPDYYVNSFGFVVVVD